MSTALAVCTGLQNPDSRKFKTNDNTMPSCTTQMKLIRNKPLEYWNSSGTLASDDWCFISDTAEFRDGGGRLSRGGGNGNGNSLNSASVRVEERIQAD